MARKEASKFMRLVVTATALDSAGSVNIPVLLTTATVYSKSFRLDDAISANVSAVIGLVAATGSAKITAVIEQSYEPPLVEGSAHPSYINTDTIMNTFSTVGTHTRNTITLSGLKYGRIKLTSVTPNTSAYVVVTVSKQVEAI